MEKDKRRQGQHVIARRYGMMALADADPVE
jgi:hypothetical protein